MSAGLPRAYKVLITDDSEEDRYFLRCVIDRFPCFEIVGEAEDGEEAICYLAGQNQYSDRRKHPVPDLILLDLKMPRKNGFDVLQWLHTQWFPRLTVVVLSDSSLAEDVGASLALGAHGYWTKTAGARQQNKIAEEVEELLEKRWSKWIESSAPQTSPRLNRRHIKATSKSLSEK